MESRVPQEVKCIVGQRIQNRYSALLGCFSAVVLLLKQFGSPQRKTPHGGARLPPPSFLQLCLSESQQYLKLAKQLLSRAITALRRSLIDAHSSPVEEVGGKQFQILFFFTYQRVFAFNSWHEWVNHFGYKIMIRPSPPINAIRTTFVRLKICAAKCVAEYKKNMKTVLGVCVWLGIRHHVLCLLWKTPTGQIGLNTTHFFLRQPPTSRPFSQHLIPWHGPLALCSVHHAGQPEMSLCALPSCPTQARI